MGKKKCLNNKGKITPNIWKKVKSHIDNDD